MYCILGIIFRPVIIIIMIGDLSSIVPLTWLLISFIWATVMLLLRL